MIDHAEEDIVKGILLRMITTQIYTHVTITRLREVHSKTQSGYKDRKPDENR